MMIFNNLTPSNILTFIQKYLKYFIIMMVIFLLLGGYFGFYYSPEDYQQGEYVRIMYVHVPSAWLALGIYSLMGIFSFIYLVWKNPISDLIAKSSAPIGGVFCFITLVTGSLWGKPVWGTWWVWDARLTSMLILLFFYIGYIILVNLTEDKANNKAAACLAIFGLINVPIIKFSVNLWSSLHQPASVFRVGGPSIHSSMLTPLILMFIGLSLYFIVNLLINLEIRILNNKFKRNTYA